MPVISTSFVQVTRKIASLSQTKCFLNRGAQQQR